MVLGLPEQRELTEGSNGAQTKTVRAMSATQVFHIIPGDFPDHAGIEGDVPVEEEPEQQPGPRHGRTELVVAPGPLARICGSRFQGTEGKSWCSLW